MNISTYRHLREYSYEYTPLHIRSVVPVAGKRERFVLYILVPAYCKGEIYTYLQRLLVRERFLLYIPVPTYCEGEICTYLYHLTVSDRFVHNFFQHPVRERLVHMLYLYQPPVRGRFVLYILVPAYCEGEFCTHLHQLPVGERFELYVLVPAYCEREIVHICTSLL